MFIDRQMNEENVVYTHKCMCTEGFSSTLKKKEILTFPTTWMDTDSIMLNDKSEKDKYRIISLICGIK